jgi:hypothetical protein
MTQKSNTGSIVIWGAVTLLVLLLLAGWLANLDASFGDALPGTLKTAAMMISGLLAGSLIILAIFGTLRLFSRWFPIARAYELTYTQADWQDFQRHYWISALVYLAITIVLSYLFYYALLLLARLSTSLISAKYVVPVAQDFWKIPAIFGALFCAIVITYQLYRWKMKDRFPRFLAFHNQRFGFDQRKAGIVMVVFGILFSIGLVIIGLNLYLRIGTDGLAINRFFGLIENRYPYAEITSFEERIITQREHPEQVLDHSFVIKFKDGRQWRSSSYGSRPVPHNILEALEFAARESGHPLDLVITTQTQ